MSQAQYCQPPDPNLRAPIFKLQVGAVDCHAHICGPADLFPYASNRIYTPYDALLPEYMGLLSSLGVSRAVLVQPSIYGEDNSALIAALMTHPEILRGVAVVNNDITENEIDHLHRVGVRGVRCNIVDLADAKGILPFPALKKLAEKIAPWGWHIELLMHANEFPDIAKSFHNFPVPIVLGHFGYLPCAVGIQNSGFQGLLSLMREGRAWVKLTAPYRISGIGKLPYGDVDIFAKTILENSPSQIVWGTDWPHVMVKNTMPNDADLCNLLFDWVPNESLRELILVKNPQRLYQFD
jgi:predicted TIM-barrel fold metal-dependent hydrolase